jgi:hypothetical protein
MRVRAERLLRRGLQRYGHQLIASDELDALEQAGGVLPPPVSAATPAAVRKSLRPDHPRLLELRRRYAGHPAAAGSVWTSGYISADLSLPDFRADNVYVWQSRGRGVQEINYLLSAYYVRSVDRLGLLDRFTEDDAFGNLFVEIEDGFAVSREVLDSVLEIEALDRHLRLLDRPAVRIVDIGAGYGRLAHRLTQALPNLERVYCTDAVPESTFISEYYLRYRGVQDTAVVVPLDEASSVIADGAVDVAVNVHSFSECPLAAIEWWLALLAQARVRHLFIVPNTGEQLVTREADGRSLDFAPAIRAHGYELIAREPKYRRSLGAQRHGLYPTHYHLFERRG